MNNTKKLSELIVAKSISNKRITRLPDGYAEEVEYYCDMIARFNALPRNAANIDGNPLSKVPIVEVLKGFVYPNSITLSGKETETDFLCRLDDVKARPLDVERMHDFVSLFTGIFKIPATEVTLEDCRTDLSLASEDVEKMCSFNGMCVTDTPVSFPYPVTTAFYKKSKFVFEEEEVFKELLDKKFKSFGHK